MPHMRVIRAAPSVAPWKPVRGGEPTDCTHCGRAAGGAACCFLAEFGDHLGIGSFDWDLDAGLMHMDAKAHEIFDIRPEEYDGRPETLDLRVPRPRPSGSTASSPRP